MGVDQQTAYAFYRSLARLRIEFERDAGGRSAFTTTEE